MRKGSNRSFPAKARLEIDLKKWDNLKNEERYIPAEQNGL
jgi:hypothetical protein